MSKCSKCGSQASFEYKMKGFRVVLCREHGMELNEKLQRVIENFIKDSSENIVDGQMELTVGIEITD